MELWESLLLNHTSGRLKLQHRYAAQNISRQNSRPLTLRET